MYTFWAPYISLFVWRPHTILLLTLDMLSFKNVETDTATFTSTPPSCVRTGDRHSKHVSLSVSLSVSVSLFDKTTPYLWAGKELTGVTAGGGIHLADGTGTAHCPPVGLHTATRLCWVCVEIDKQMAEIKWQNAGLMIGSSLVRSLKKAAGKCSSPGSTFCHDSYFGIRSTPVLPQ